MTDSSSSATAARPTSSSPRPSREPMILGATLAILAILVVWGLPSYGIWDPWELGTADDARHMLEGEPVDELRAPLGAWLVARAFGVFGVHEWSGRLPIALAGLFLLGVAGGLGRLYGDLRRGTYLAIVLATTPLFLLNARHMMGLAPGFLFSGLVFACAAGTRVRAAYGEQHGVARWARGGARRLDPPRDGREPVCCSAWHRRWWPWRPP